ncbi:crosslink repair DNA glycosylase YcaQ family protein [Cytophagaceae bacterium DM2B3-1]|uniref:Crosslink repair DNA glycosylase YcaQ family protein n=1 Tax=Xanthocytophaga flava TaxID=3048013 RepID=A0ABT7CUL4_9BACT|nr:crosslink repair DNA glycosylase YcaQ family protein [Xanthocytophaga flavus]MDJ1467044.1 crosslink repair DNA glycosylase YcaQ family protein [Xanthocytophaga flavus]MDJ1497460.1 crosslink repair DNA glycosylase YcaQ family protein [Xanthocytophaga flavus]
MNKHTLTQAEARKIILHAAGLSKQAQFGKGKEAVYDLIDHLGFLQLDSNYVVERAHHHAIAARVPDYKIEWLDELQAEGRIFEFWTYAAGYIPMHDFRFSLPTKESFASRRDNMTRAEVYQMEKVLDRVGREGPLMARDFENDRVTESSGWWDWRPSKLALERLHLEGKLMVMKRKEFQKVFDLPENLLPADIDTTPPTAEEFAIHLILRSLKALGIAYLKDIAYRGRYVKNAMKTELKKLIESGEVCEVEVSGVTGATLYMLSEYKNKSIDLAGDAFILSPFDTLNVYRHRLRSFFNFDYQVECFVPMPKRKYGYFSLPILIGDTFVARMDSKADRKKRVLLIHNLHFEPVALTDDMISQMIEALKAFAMFNQCEQIVIAKSNDEVLRKAIDTELAKDNYKHKLS